MKKICFIAQFPPPIHGLSKAVETLYDSDVSGEFGFEKVDITDNRRFFSNLLAIMRSDADLFYFTISQTKGGNLRDLLILRVLRMRKKRVLLHLHGGYYRQLVDHDLGAAQRRANYRAMGRLDGAIVLGPSLKPIFQGMLPDEKIFTVPNCVDDAYLMSDEAFDEKLKGLSERSVKHVLYLSNFIKTKGYPDVLQMARMEKDRVAAGQEKRYHFDFAGKFFDPEDERFFNDYVKDNGLEGFVTYHGVVSGAAKAKLLRQCDAFALLTRYPKEGQPISILEAMGNGMAVVTTDHAGIPDIVDATCGVMVKASSEDLAQDALDALENIDFERYERAARETVKARFTQRQYLDNMTAVFRRLTSGS